MERTFGIKAFPSNRFSISQLTPRRRQTGAPIPRPSRAKNASQLSPRVPAVRQQCLISRCRIRSPKKLRNGLPRHFHVPPKDCQLQKETKWSHCAFELLASRPCAEPPGPNVRVLAAPATMEAETLWRPAPGFFAGLQNGFVLLVPLKANSKRVPAKRTRPGKGSDRLKNGFFSSTQAGKWRKKPSLRPWTGRLLRTQSTIPSSESTSRFFVPHPLAFSGFAGFHGQK